MRDRFVRLLQKVRHARSARAAVLVYHRVAELADDPFSLAVTPRHFAEHLRVLRESFVPVPLRELVSATEEGDVPHRGVAITFDDGYTDNLRRAKPLLEEGSLPATVFVVAGGIGSEEEFWWDRLERLVLRGRTVPAELRLQLGDRTFRWQAGNGDPLRVPAARQRVFREIWKLLQPLGSEARGRLMNEIAAQIDEAPAPRPDDLPLSEAALADLARSGLVEIGAHGLTHSRLAGLPAAEQRHEVSESRRRLESLVAAPVTSFAYPYGTRGDYTQDTAAIVADCGFRCACANASGWVVSGVDPFALPRVRVYDWSGEELAHRLRRFLWA